MRNNFFKIALAASLGLALAFNSGCSPDDGGSIPNPDPPTGVVASTNSTNSITIGWGTVSGANGYYIYRSTDKTGPYEQIGSSTSTSYTDNSLQAGTTYYYRIAAYNKGGTGSESSFISITTIPDAPTSVVAMVNSENSITISWKGVSGATGYRIYRSTTSSGTYELAGTTTAISYTSPGLTAGTTYYYKVAASNSSGEGPQSDKVSAITLPMAPAGMTATANSTSSITISWSTVTGADGYKIYRSTTSSGTYEEISTSTTTSYTNVGLTINTVYYYKVSAYNSSGEGSQSKISAITLPETPVGITTTTNSTSITINWSAVTGVDGYKIYRSTTSSGTYEEISSSTSISYTDIGLTSNTTYYYKIAAYNNGGESSKSDVVSATTLPPTCKDRFMDCVQISGGSASACNSAYNNCLETVCGNEMQECAFTCSANRECAGCKAYYACAGI